MEATERCRKQPKIKYRRKVKSIFVGRPFCGEIAEIVKKSADLKINIVTFRRRAIFYILFLRYTYSQSKVQTSPVTGPSILNFRLYRRNSCNQSVRCRFLKQHKSYFLSEYRTSEAEGGRQFQIKEPVTYDFT